MTSESARRAGSDALHLLQRGLDVPAERATQDWRGTGLPAPAGRARGRPATLARVVAQALADVSVARRGTPLVVDGPALLGRRALLHPEVVAAGLPAPTTARVQLVEAADGWWVLNLARADDVELVPALVERTLDVDASTQTAWSAVQRWSRDRAASDVVARAVELGMPAARLGETPAPPAPWTVGSTPADTAAPPVARRERVVNLGSLWAAPLTAHLLGRVGMEVVHVESTRRPDASRTGTPRFHDELRAGHEVEALDLATGSGRHRLAALLRTADVVIEASRPRALEGLGVPPAVIMADGRPRTWLQITGHGPDQPHRVAFGDDAAVAGGLVSVDVDGVPSLYGDALADPLTGLVGALAVTAVHRDDRQSVVRTSLAGCAAFAVAAGDLPG